MALLLAELRASMRIQALALRAGTVLLLCWPLTAAIGSLLHGQGVYPGWLQAFVEHRGGLLLPAMLFSPVALCDSIFGLRTPWQYLGKMARAVALGPLGQPAGLKAAAPAAGGAGTPERR